MAPGVDGYRAIALGALAALALSSHAAPDAASLYRASVDTGVLAGQAAEHAPEVREFLGIPFAAPPIGALRWRPPAPPSAWQGARDATRYGNRCMQPTRRQTDGPGVSEDCLFLNVWTQAQPGAAQPVMVWIHGGALVSGSGDRHNGANLARRGVVVVTLNYRLGALGYLAHPLLSEESGRGAAGNYGVLDQIAALRWVQRNIAAFGGNPGNVTIFGESAGSWSVQVLVASPLAAGLFHRAIGESGGVLGSYDATPELASLEVDGAEFADALLGETPVTLASLRALPARDLVRPPSGARMPIRPAVDGWVLPNTARDIFLAGRQNRVPVMVGWNADEGSLGVREVPENSDAYLAWANEEYGTLAAAFLELYPPGESEIRANFLKAYGDRNFGWEMRTWARLTDRAGMPAYLYHFSRVPPGSTVGTYHSAEIRYVFDNLSAPGSRHEYGPRDEQLANVMAAVWVQFAKSGNPNSEQMPIWSAFEEESEILLDFGDSVSMRRNFRKAQLDLHDRFYRLERP